MDWEQFLQREDIVGGDIETHEDGYIYRGPIDNVELKDGQVHFESPWTARIPKDLSEEWEVWDITSCSMSTDNKLQDIGDGRLLIDMPLLDHAVIFPKGGSKLDPAKVKGLEIS